MIPTVPHNWKLILNVVCLFGTLTFGVLYVGQINAAARMGYDLKLVQSGIESRRIANQQLETRIAENRAMANVVRRVSILGMTRPTTVTYIQDVLPSVAFVK